MRVSRDAIGRRSFGVYVSGMGGAPAYLLPGLSETAGGGGRQRCTRRRLAVPHSRATLPRMAKRIDWYYHRKG